MVHSEQGVEEHTRTLYHLARHLGVPTILPVVNMPVHDPETLELVVMELEELGGMGEVQVVVDMVGREEGLVGVVEELERRVEQAGLVREEEGEVHMVLEQVESYAIFFRESLMRTLTLARWGASLAGGPSAPGGC